MTPKEKAKVNFDRQAKDYDTDRNSNGRMSRTAYGPILERLGGIKYGSILDVGCGTGELLSLTGSRASKAGIDISPEMIAVARKKLGSAADLKEGDSASLPWAGESFDVVMSNFSFHHYTDPSAVAGEMMRVLKGGGSLIIGDCWAPTPARQLLNVLMKFGDEGDHHLYSRGEICGLLEKSGFQHVDWARVDKNAFVVTAAKPGGPPK